MSSAGAPQEEGPPGGWRVRAAGRSDAPALAVGVAELLVEIGGKPAPAEQLEAAARALIEDPEAGALLLAEAPDGSIVGCLGASWAVAVRIPGRYGTIEELWVKRGWRGQAIGAQLLGALFELARERGISRVEVGLPGASFAGLEATSAFYAASGFTQVGMRMRRLLG